eukprot:CAMPEP_0176085426 /NCGR_PEP_ID=MMETSP0120_2-20121206/42753_1 /TAXON_ID=160619 /ORGANISM="Kryptoperidinium foliaceum, Strain CCMP 1326" /LENGTH=517 /DNA_ID=CAMNT_0017419239 /DNA_START=33 /DNA_END=1583 /DNA_ORIENTATION=+
MAAFPDDACGSIGSGFVPGSAEVGDGGHEAVENLLGDLEPVQGSEASLTRMPLRFPDSLSHMQVVAPIGYGAYAQVLEVHDTRDSSRYALKIVEKEPMVARGMLPQLARELAVQRGLSHPNIVRVLELAEDDTHAYTLLRLCIGGSVWQATHSFHQQVVPEPLAAQWLRGATEGVVHLHDFGIVHRDVKLENLLLDGDGRALLCDFGWCDFEEDQPFGLCGTPQLMAPEVLESDLQSFKMDVWALGACLAQLLKGVPLEGPQDAWLPTAASDAAHDLAEGLLQRDPALRIDARSALSRRMLKDVTLIEGGGLPVTPPGSPSSCRSTAFTEACSVGLRANGELRACVDDVWERLRFGPGDCSSRRSNRRSEEKSACFSDDAGPIVAHMGSSACAGSAASDLSAPGASPYGVVGSAVYVATAASPRQQVVAESPKIAFSPASPMLGVSAAVASASLAGTSAAGQPASSPSSQPRPADHAAEAAALHRAIKEHAENARVAAQEASALAMKALDKVLKQKC